MRGAADELGWLANGPELPSVELWLNASKSESVLERNDSSSGDVGEQIEALFAWKWFADDLNKVRVNVSSRADLRYDLLRFIPCSKKKTYSCIVFAQNVDIWQISHHLLDYEWSQRLVLRTHVDGRKERHSLNTLTSLLNHLYTTSIKNGELTGVTIYWDLSLVRKKNILLHCNGGVCLSFEQVISLSRS